MNTKRLEKLNVTCKMLALTAVVMMMSVVFTACSGDDDDSKPNPDAVEYVDLKLPSGTKWATCNIGAKQPKEYGDYYAWGEIKTKENYDWSTYKWMEEGQADWKYITKYTVKDNLTEAIWYKKFLHIYKFIGDNKNTLEDMDDVATVKLGKPWRTPTSGEIKELIDNCQWAIINADGVKYLQGKSLKNNNIIILPCAGVCDGTNVQKTNIEALLWSSSIYSNASTAAYILQYQSGNSPILFIADRIYGLPVRPVRK